MIFLDTDIISYHFSSHTKIKDKLLELADQDERICITVINVYEILKGLKWKNNLQTEAKLMRFIEKLPLFTINKYVINIAANIYANLRKKGISIGDSDILIAAIVIANNGTLVTNNIKHFENIEQLKVVNWVLK